MESEGEKTKTKLKRHDEEGIVTIKKDATTTTRTTVTNNNNKITNL